MITIIDRDGNKTAVENLTLETKIKARWAGLAVTNIVIEKGTTIISATVESLGKYIGCGWVEDYLIYASRKVREEINGFLI